jgi:hypothetical protein
MGEMTAVSKLEEKVPAPGRDTHGRCCGTLPMQMTLFKTAWCVHSTGWGALQTDDDLRPWLFTIMHNIFASRWRRMTNRVRLLRDHGEPDVAVAPMQEESLHVQDVLRGPANTRLLAPSLMSPQCQTRALNNPRTVLVELGKTRR